MRYTGKEMIRIIDAYTKEFKVPKMEFYKKAKISSATACQWRGGQYNPCDEALQTVIEATVFDEIGFQEYADLILGNDKPIGTAMSTVDWGTMTIEEIEGIKNLIRSLGGKIL